MKSLTKSDLINIEALKQLIKCVSNDIKDAKEGTAAPSEKADQVFKLTRQRVQLINQATGKYPHIDWVKEAIGIENGFEVSRKETARMKIDMKFNFN